MEPRDSKGCANGEDKERERIKNRLMWYGTLTVIALLVVLVVFDVWDDAFGSCKYEVPGWLITLVTGIFATLFAKAGLDIFRRNGGK